MLDHETLCLLVRQNQERRRESSGNPGANTVAVCEDKKNLVSIADVRDFPLLIKPDEWATRGKPEVLVLV